MSGGRGSPSGGPALTGSSLVAGWVFGGRGILAGAPLSQAPPVGRAGRHGCALDISPTSI